MNSCSLRPRRRAASCVCASALALAGCGSARQDVVPASGHIATATASITATTAGVTLALRSPSGSETPVAVLRGVRFDAGEGPRELPFRSMVDQPDAVHLTVDSPPDHELNLDLGFDPDGALRVSLSDRVLSRARVSELSLGWQALMQGEIEEVSVPLPHPAPGMVAGDAAFRCPIAFLRRGGVALAVIPDLVALADERVLPQALELDRTEPPTLRHSLVAQSFAEDGQRLVRDDDDAVIARRETLHLVQRVVSLPAPPGSNPLSTLRDRIWQDLAAPRLQQRPDPLVDKSLDDHADAILQDARARLLRRRPHGVGEQLFVVDPNRSDASQETMSFGARSNSLQLALAFALRGARLDDRNLKQTGARITAFALTAPNRSGLIPFGLRRDTASGRESWMPGDPKGSRPECFSALDAATTGRLLLELAGLQPELAEAIRGVCGDLAHFFRDNQAADGSIPAFYEAEFLRPLTVVDDDPVAATAGPALFLALWSNWSDDSAARDAARRAISHLAGRALPIRAFADPGRPTVEDARSGMERMDLVPLSLAARAAIELASTDPGLRDPTLALLDQIAGFQQVWDPPWLPIHAFGGFGGSNADCTWNDGAGPLAVQALLDGYRLFGRRLDLQRGVAGLRATLVDAAPFHPDGRPRADAAPFAAAALVVAERTRRDLGQAVLDVDGNFAQGIDTVLVETDEPNDADFAIRVGTFAGLSAPITLRLHHATRPVARLQINGSKPFVVDTPAGAAIPVEPVRLPILAFRPPREIAQTPGWRPAALWRGRMPPEGSCSIEVGVRIGDADRPVGRVPMLATADGVLAPGVSFVGLGLRDGDLVHAHLRCDVDGFHLREPMRGDRRLAVGTFEMFDVGDDLERTLVDDTGPSTRIRYGTGREFARRIESGHSLAYSVTAPKDAAAVELEILASGAIHLFGSTGSAVLLREDASTPTGPREIAVKLADPRLWSDGSLLLRFTPAGAAPLDLAAIRFRWLGNAVVTSPQEVRESPREPLPTIDVVVVPIQCAGDGARATEALKLAVFGGDEYRVTPEPLPRPTAGSLARFVDRLSGGRTTLGGAVLDPLRIDAPLAELAATPSPARDALAGEIATELTQPHGAILRPAQVVLAVHDGPPIPGVDGRRIGVVGGAPVILCAERSADGSYLSCGRLAQLVLGSVFSFADLSGTDQGAFGELALASSQTGHAPSPPLGPNLLATGWASVVALDPGTDRTIRLAPSIEGRTILRLPSGPLLRRGTLYLENRLLPSGLRGPHGEPAGLLLFWDMRDAVTPWMTRVDGRVAHPGFWRLAPDRTASSTPFEPGRAEDLFGSITALDEHSSPSLATAAGDLPWAISDLTIDEGGTASFRVRWRGLDMARRPTGFGAGSGDQLGPLPDDGVDRGSGTALRSASELRIALPSKPEARILQRIALPRIDAPMRLFGEFGSVVDGTLRVRIRMRDEDLLDATIDPRGARWTVELPGGIEDGESLELLYQRVDGQPRIGLLSLVAFPLFGADGRLALPGLPDRSAYGADGRLHGRPAHLALDRGARRELRVPVVLPTARGNLRLLLGRPRGAGDPIRLTVELRDPERPRSLQLLRDHRLDPADGESALLLELPSGSADRVGFLDLVLEGTRGEELLVLDAAVTRG
ncbi:MAG: hypothetical protein U1F36_18765 [Planctomycetota bacterium]